jgi:hypothetical protein
MGVILSDFGGNSQEERKVSYSDAVLPGAVYLYENKKKGRRK